MIWKKKEPTPTLIEERKSLLLSAHEANEHQLRDCIGVRVPFRTNAEHEESGRNRLETDTAQ